MSEELPPGFEFRPHSGGPGLFVGEEMVAHACTARSEPGAPWRLCLMPRKPPRYEFLADEATCRRYMAAWARKWRAEILERVGQPNLDFVHLARPDTAAEPPAATSHIRPKARRRPPRFR